MADWSITIVTVVQRLRRCRSFSLLHLVVVTSSPLALSSGPLLLSEGLWKFLSSSSQSQYRCAPALWVFFTGSRTEEEEAEALGHEQVIAIFLLGTYLVRDRLFNYRHASQKASQGTLLQLTLFCENAFEIGYWNREKIFSKMLPTSISRHPPEQRFWRSYNSLWHLSTKTCVVPMESWFHTLLIVGAGLITRGAKTENHQHQKQRERQVCLSSETLKLRRRDHKRRTGPHTFACCPFETNTFLAILTLVADFGPVWAHREIHDAKHVDRRRWRSILVWSHQLTQALTSIKRCSLFGKCLHWSCLKAVPSVPTFVIGGLRGSTATSGSCFSSPILVLPWVCRLSLTLFYSL